MVSVEVNTKNEYTIICPIKLSEYDVNAIRTIRDKAGFICAAKALRWKHPEIPLDSVSQIVKGL